MTEASPWTRPRESHCEAPFAFAGRARFGGLHRAQVASWHSGAGIRAAGRHSMGNGRGCRRDSNIERRAAPTRVRGRPRAFVGCGRKVSFNLETRFLSVTKKATTKVFKKP